VRAAAPGGRASGNGAVTMVDWQPIGITELELGAWGALRDDGCTAVVAGPGAGKTEFLAQRAAFLLQTGRCPAPRRVLAISCKRDSAANLARRVTSRVPEHAARFGAPQNSRWSCWLPGPRRLRTCPCCCSQRRDSAEHW
jgi:hypothetical protein